MGIATLTINNPFTTISEGPYEKEQTMTRRTEALRALRKAKKALETGSAKPSGDPDQQKPRRRKRGRPPVPRPKHRSGRHVGRERTECTLLEFLELRGMSMRHVSRCAGVDVGAIHKYCHNKALPNVLIAQRVAHVMRTSVGQLWPLPPIIKRPE